jgi:hypothetical protein
MKKIVSILLCLILLAGCSNGSSKQTNTEADKFHPEMLKYDEFLEDYNYFWDTITLNYPFINVAKRQGVDMDVIEAEGRARLNQSTNLAEFADIMKDTINGFQGVGHMSFIAPQAGDTLNYPYFLSSYGDTPPKKLKNHIDYLLKALTEPKTVSVYSYLSGNIEGGVEENLQENINKAAEPDKGNLSSNILKKDEIAYIKINSFRQENITYDYEVLKLFYSDVKDYKNIIIDLRGNGGGSDNYWMKNIVEPLNNKNLESKNYLLFSNTPEITKYVSLDGIYKASSLISEVRELPELNQDDAKMLTHVFISTRTVKKSSDFKGKVWVLVDEQVYSASETFAMFCKSTGFATIVGTNTSGDGGGIDPMLFTLPNTGLLWRNSIFYSINPDGSNNEEMGTTPDILIKQGESALNVCQERIKGSNP